MHPRAVKMAEQIMSEDRDILQALAGTQADTQMAVARDVMKRRRSALGKLSK